MNRNGACLRAFVAGALVIGGCTGPSPVSGERSRPPIAAGSTSAPVGPSAPAPSDRVELLRALVLPGGTSAAPASTREELSLVRLGLADESMVPARERDGLARAIEDAYADLDARHGALPSVWLESVTSAPSATRFVTLLSEPPSGDPTLGVVFLHGYGGNFTWPCALVAEAAQELGGVTLCPSVGRDGAWDTGAGPAIVSASIAALRARGVREVVLAGLSNGAVGAARLAASIGPLAGLLLISGAPRGGHFDRPTLVVHGTNDTMTPAASARAFVHRSPHAELELLAGGHFVLAHQRDVIRARIGTWLHGLVP